MAVTLAVVAAVIGWLKHSAFPGVFRAAALGALGSLAFAIPMRMALRGIVLRAWKS
jgi:hypothetical protein